MKLRNIVFTLVSIFAFAGMVQAQRGTARLDLSYTAGLPLGSFKENLNETSFRGFNGALMFGVNDNVSVGISAGFQDFYQKHPRQLYKLDDGSDISAVLSHSIQTIPIMAKAGYQFQPGAVVQPYAALSVGGNMITYSELLGEFGGQQAKFGFAARPEAGIYIPFKKDGESGLKLGASYNIMPFKELPGFKNLNHLGIHAGISVPMRK